MCPLRQLDAVRGYPTCPCRRFHGLCSSSTEEALLHLELRRGFEASLTGLCSSSTTSAVVVGSVAYAGSVPSPPVYHMVPPVPNWPWETLIFVDLSRDEYDDQ
ncbi:hypothetical protein QYE76_000679 [Lolium multiflorum]|uniref:Uncharacterized protein n=1 Tax=Lolium multiflorum TaxID=4521 RepID=A0AAD8RJT5_LOLMU|nr:hypothetical protein QYE76_000679 [Lolium multiflorum]